MHDRLWAREVYEDDCDDYYVGYYYHYYYYYCCCCYYYYYCYCYYYYYYYFDGGDDDIYGEEEEDQSGIIADDDDRDGDIHLAVRTGICINLVLILCLSTSITTITRQLALVGSTAECSGLYNQNLE